MGAGVGLHRVLDLCRGPLAGEWLTRADAVKVTGSNGKGSVCAMVASILRSAGVRTGLYTSPHLFDFGERIAVDGQPISEADLGHSLDWFEGEHARYLRQHPEDRVGAFEAFTALAVHHFSRVGPEAAVIEAGIGGRFDPTRIFPGRLTGLVSLDLEHTALLGDSLEQIAYDKADLADAGGTLVVGPVPPEILRRLRAYGRLRGLEVLAAEEVCRVRRAHITAGGSLIDVDLLDGDLLDGDLLDGDGDSGGRRWDGVEFALLGSHQIANARVAIVLAQRWLARHRVRSDGMDDKQVEAAVREGLAAVRWPCRLERVRRDPDVFVDAAHTLEAISALVRSVGEILPDRRILLVTGVSQDKDADAIVPRLLAVAGQVIATRARHKGRDADDIASIVKDHDPETLLSSRPTLRGALDEALARAASDGSVVLVAGGLFLAAEAAGLLIRRQVDRVIPG